MNEQVLIDTMAAFNASRDYINKAFRSVCYAPYVSLYFDQLGNVRACCQNSSFTVGSIVSQTLDEIWRGPKIQQLRNSLANNDLRNGCRFCEWQFFDANPAGTFIKRFDEFAIKSPEPDWPMQMEFSISNTCNLECVMCNGEWSSSIRSRREKLPPLPKAYGEEFFKQLASYLPHLKRANFLGGEPFLARETMRIWSMMLDLGVSTPCHVTTNGTQYNDHVQRILDALPISFSVSMDGVTRETVESIRKNAKFDEVRANARRFRDYAAARGTTFSLTYCLMRGNWQEFGDYLLLGDEWDCDVFVNTVTHPTEVSLYTLPAPVLRQVIADLETKDEYYQNRLGRNRPIWIEELSRLRNRLDHPDGAKMFARWGSPLGQTSSEQWNAITYDDASARLTLEEWSGHPAAAVLELDASLHILDAQVEDPTRLRMSAEDLRGQVMSAVEPLLVTRFGPVTHRAEHVQTATYMDDASTFGAAGGPQVELRAITLIESTETGFLKSGRVFIGIRDLISDPMLILN